MTPSASAIDIQLLADHPALIPAIGELRWREWGDGPDADDLTTWIAITEREAGCEALPVTWVARDEHGVALGAVALDRFDLAERRDRSPWVVGVIVHPDRRGQGIGGLLMAYLEAWARDRHYEQLWVATGGRAIAFYQRCGWHVHEAIAITADETATVLTKQL